MKRSNIGLEAIADWHNLMQAFYLAARGKKQRIDVVRFRCELDQQLKSLQQNIVDQTYEPESMSQFHIHDPKIRLIHAPSFRDRVLHHALIQQVGPVLDRSLVYDTYACRIGKGSLAAAQRCQQHSRRYTWYAKIDIRAYFASIDHLQLKSMLQQRFKNRGLLDLMARIIDSHHTEAGKGLPIGALTSQHFANLYLSGLDRLLLEHCGVEGMVRYMDDVIWWCDSRSRVKKTLKLVDTYVSDELALEIKSNSQINQSPRGVSFCGFRVFPWVIRLSARKRRRYTTCRQYWENQFLQGNIDINTLQAGYSAALAITLHADAVDWRKQELRRYPPPQDI